MGGGNSKRKSSVTEAETHASQSNGVPASPAISNLEKVRGSPAASGDGTPTKAGISKPTPSSKSAKPLPQQSGSSDNAGRAQAASDSASVIAAFYEVRIFD
jgi:hypothetical protein